MKAATSRKSRSNFQDLTPCLGWQEQQVVVLRLAQELAPGWVHWPRVGTLPQCGRRQVEGSGLADLPGCLVQEFQRQPGQRTRSN